ncbi:MAG: phosphatase PAP2 family protein [Gemmatimonadota bacterium]
MTDLWPLLFGDEPIRWVQQLFGLGHPLPFRVFSLLGDTWGMILVVGVAFWLFGRERLYATAGIVAVGAATKVALSMVFQQTRPSGAGIVVYEHLDVSSFPSGHVYATVGPWGLLAVLGCIAFGLAALVAVLVGLGRMYLGTHYLGDVLGGIVFGAALVWAYHRLWPRARGWLARRGFTFYACLAGAVVAAALAWIALAGGHPRRWEVVGILLGASLGLPLEHRYVRYPAGRAGRGQALLRTAVGVAGVAGMLLLDRSAGEDALLLGTLTAGLATLWAVWWAPLVFVRLGWAGREVRGNHA